MVLALLWETYVGCGAAELGAGVTGSEMGALAASLVALVEVRLPVCWVPAVAGAVGLAVPDPVEVVGSESCLAICEAVTDTGLGTGYSLGIEPRSAYV